MGKMKIFDKIRFLLTNLFFWTCIFATICLVDQLVNAGRPAELFGSGLLNRTPAAHEPKMIAMEPPVAAPLATGKMGKVKNVFKAFLVYGILTVPLLLSRAPNELFTMVNNNRQNVRGFPDKLDCVPMVYGSAESALYFKNRFKCKTDIYLPETGLKLPPEKDISSSKDVLLSSAPAEAESPSSAEAGKRGRKKGGKNRAKNHTEEETNESIMKEKFPMSRPSLGAPPQRPKTEKEEARARYVAAQTKKRLLYEGRIPSSAPEPDGVENNGEKKVAVYLDLNDDENVERVFEVDLAKCKSTNFVVGIHEVKECPIENQSDPTLTAQIVESTANEIYST